MAETPLKHLNKYLVKYRLRLLAGLLFVSLSNVFAIFPGQVVRKALDLLAAKVKLYPTLHSLAEQTALKGELAKSAILFALLILGLALLKGVFMFFMRQTLIVMSRLVEYDLKNEIFDQYQQLSSSFYRRNNTGDLMARISEDVSRVRMYIGPAIMYTINLVVLFILVISTMISVNMRLTFFVLLPLPFLGVSIYFVSSLIEKKSDRVQGRLSALSTYVQEAFSGIRVLKSYVREQSAVHEFSKESERYMAESLDLARINALFFPIMLVLVGLSTLLTIFVGGMEVISGRATFGNIAEFIFYVNILTWPFASVGWVTSLVQRASASQRRINEFLKTKPEVMSGTYENTTFKGHVVFKNVSFTYPDTGICALKDINLEIEPGRSLAIVGRTGSGKSTVASLLLRLYDIKEGAITIDGEALCNYSFQNLRDNIGYVPQDVFLFSDTIANNISFGLKNLKADMLQIGQAAKNASVYDNIMEFPQGFETLIGERGITLSGGQKQRVSIARAIIKAPKILVFDDCLSAVDTHTEEEILSNLRRVMKGKTTLLISHRVSTVKHADQILVLDEGRIIESGKHEELLAKKGFYQQMHQAQLYQEATS